MPEAFEKCVKNGGRVRTISGPNKEQGLSKDEYVHICFINNESFRGHVKVKGEKSKEKQSD